jgi:hypothetical protein
VRPSAEWQRRHKLKDAMTAQLLLARDLQAVMEHTKLEATMS